MKKISIINLIKYYADKNDVGFRNEAHEIAKSFDENGDTQLSEYIMALLASNNTFVPQIYENELTYMKKVPLNNNPLPLPEALEKDVIGTINAISHNAGINKFLFYGAPGTGKTETVKQIARILERDLYVVDFSSLIDSKLGQSQKNIDSFFEEINSCSAIDKILILFDEIDALVLDRTNCNDLREMGRVTSTFLKELDNLNENVLLFATTNLFKNFDKAILRRFDSCISFDRYSIEDLQNIGVEIVDSYYKKFNFINKNTRLLKKIIFLMNPVLSPGELKNVIKTSIAFSNVNDGNEYLRRIYSSIVEKIELKKLQENGFSLREIEALTGISKSQVGRELQGNK